MRNGLDAIATADAPTRAVTLTGADAATAHAGAAADESVTVMGGDPGPCPICGAAHTACTANRGPILQVMAPQRDEMARVPLVSEVIATTLEAGSFTTATYRRGKTKPGQ